MIVQRNFYCIAIRNHEASNCHVEAVEALFIIPCTTADIGELMARQHEQQNLNGRHALQEIFLSVWYLCRQGLPLCGDEKEKDGNLNQLLYMKAEKDEILANWLKRKENVYTSPTIQNEMIKLMGLSMLRSIVTELQKAPFLSIMVDKTTDASNEEQVTLLLRQMTDTLDVNEEFHGLYHADSIEAASVAMVITNVFQQYGLSIWKTMWSMLRRG